MQDVRDITGGGKGSASPPVWPNARAMADAIGEDYQRVRKWLLRGRIPSYAWPAIIRESADTARPLTADELVALHAPKKKPARKAQPADHGTSRRERR